MNWVDWIIVGFFGLGILGALIETWETWLPVVLGGVGLILILWLFKHGLSNDWGFWPLAFVAFIGVGPLRFFMGWE